MRTRCPPKPRRESQYTGTQRETTDIQKTRTWDKSTEGKHTGQKYKDIRTNTESKKEADLAQIEEFRVIGPRPPRRQDKPWASRWVSEAAGAPEITYLVQKSSVSRSSE